MKWIAKKSLKKNIAKATEYFETTDGKKLPISMVNIKVDKLLRKFIIEGGFEL